MEELEQVLRREELALYRLRSLYESRGYRPYKMNKFEEYDFYARNKSFLQSEQVLTFTDTDGRLMALKPDVTLSILKNAKDGCETLQKFCYSETVYRPSGTYGGFREILQAGLECIGEVDLYAMGEVVTLAARSLASLGEKYVLGLSHLGLLSGVLDEVTDSAVRKGELLRLIGDKNLHELAGLPAEDTARLQALAKLHGPLMETLPRLERLCPRQRAELEELYGLASILSHAKEGDSVVLDFSIGGDMRYYNGLILQGFLDGIPDPVLSGGRYDSLVKKLGKQGGAIGFAVCPDRLERFDASPEYDADVLILYDAADDPCVLTAEAQRLNAAGRTVRVERRAGTLRCRETLRFRDGRFVPIETDA